METNSSNKHYSRAAIVGGWGGGDVVLRGSTFKKSRATALFLCEVIQFPDTGPSQNSNRAINFEVYLQ
jgi:hypothetical protein